MTNLTEQEAIKLFAQMIDGRSRKEAADQIGINAACISEIMNGKRRIPDQIQEALGINKVRRVTYEYEIERPNDAISEILAERPTPDIMGDDAKSGLSNSVRSIRTNVHNFDGDDFSITAVRKVVAVRSNRDLTEGRGEEYQKALCETQATANRIGRGGYVQGTDCPTRPQMLFQINGQTTWFGPVDVVKATDNDFKRQAIMNEQQAAIERAKSAGLSDDDLRLIRGGK